MGVGAAAPKSAACAILASLSHDSVETGLAFAISGGSGVTDRLR